MVPGAGYPVMMGWHPSVWGPGPITLSTAKNTTAKYKEIQEYKVQNNYKDEKYKVIEIHKTTSDRQLELQALCFDYQT